MSGHKDTVQLLVELGAEVSPKNEGEMTALMWAVSRGHKETVQVLVEHGADVNAMDEKGYMRV